MSKRGSGSSTRKSSFGNIDVGEGYKTSQRTLDIVKMSYESTTKQKDVPDWMAKEQYLREIKNRGGENPQKLVEDFYKEHESSIKIDWAKRTKRAKKFPYKTKEEWVEAQKPHGQGRKEVDITSASYNRILAKSQREFEKEFVRRFGYGGVSQEKRRRR